MTDNNDDDNESSPDLRYNKTNIELRRAAVLRELSRGLSGADIARKLNVSKSLICLDIQFLKSQAQESLRSHIQETIPFEYQKSRQALQDLIRRANDILDNNEDDKMKLSVINTLANLHAANMNLNSQGDIIQQAYDKVSTLEEIQKRNREEAVFSEQDLKEEDTNPTEPAKITTIDDADTAPESDTEEETEEE